MIQDKSAPSPASIQLVSGAVSLGVKWPGRETDHSLRVTEFKRKWYV
jgi:hypothetical protein